MKSLQISLNTAHSGCKPSSFMSSFTHSFHYLPRTLLPYHLHISTDGHPIIPTLMFQMTKPSQFAMPHHLSHTLWIPKRLQNLTLLPILQRHPHIHLTIIHFSLKKDKSWFANIVELICQCDADYRCYEKRWNWHRMMLQMIMHFVKRSKNDHAKMIDMKYIYIILYTKWRNVK